MRCLPLLAVVLALPAAAQDRPTLIPTADAAVTYRVTAPGAAPTELRMAFLTGQGLIRVDLAGDQGWILTDTRGRAGFLVIEGQRAVVELPPGRNAALSALPRENAAYVREGTDSVAGLPCTVWRVEERGRTARACLTADGVMLRAEGPQGRMEAISVSRAPQDPARFVRPAGYQPLRPPGAPAPAGELPRGTALPPPGLPQR